eukprot:1525995-Heterocapsa_arctica.AAC.1
MEMPPLGCVRLPVHDGTIDLTNLRKALPQVHWLKRYTKTSMRGPRVNPELSEYLVFCSCRSGSMWWLPKLVKLISHQLEAAYMGTGRRSSVLQRGCNADMGCYTRKRDPALRSALAKQSMASLNAKRVAKAASQLNVSLQKAHVKSGVTLQEYEKRMECLRYWKAGHQAMSEAKHLAVVVDGTRLGGRERLCGSMLNLESGVAAWMPPQVAPIIYTRAVFRVSGQGS